MCSNQINQQRTIKTGRYTSIKCSFPPKIPFWGLWFSSVMCFMEFLRSVPGGELAALCPLTSPCLCRARVPSASNSFSTSFTFKLQSGGKDAQVTQDYTSVNKVEHMSLLCVTILIPQLWKVTYTCDYTMNIDKPQNTKDVHALLTECGRLQPPLDMRNHEQV